MKKNKKILILLLLTLSLTGCTKYAKTEDNKVLTNENTGQKIVENIICKPNDSETLKIYEDNNIEISKLPTCSEYNMFNTEYEGIWNSLFVKPIAFLIVKLGQFLRNYGCAIILLTLAIRGILYPLTNKAAMQSELMNDAKKDLDKLEKKYAGRDTQEDQMAKSQEMLMIYKKYNINPLSSCLFALIQIPLFFAFYEALNRLPVVFEGKFLGLELGTSPLTGMSHGNLLYSIIIILVALTTYFSFKLNSATNTSDQAQAAQMKMMSNMSIVMITIAAFTTSTSIALYWIANSAFTIVQNLLVKIRGKKHA
ncbi:MAG: YidC/Oxa1 family membrane protein insertase [Bacilli bacterium]|nr:YidC/Oxa1 family membrane protein insertase [Bacilli bacterium]